MRRYTRNMTQKIFFRDDYTEIGHPRLIEALGKAATGKHGTYGQDDCSAKACDLIRQECGTDGFVHLIHGGTIANIVNLSLILKPYESVMACDTAHINEHEVGAIEATGHKINLIANKNGKLDVESIDEVMKRHNFYQMVQPRVVAVSQTTELGSVYSRAELTAISEYCREKGLYLYIDGARMGSALTCRDADLTLKDIAKLADIFYIGGTKNGALFGEAVVIPNKDLSSPYGLFLKQRGALLAKGATMGTQFVELFKDGLYMDLARHANAMAEKLANHLKDAGVTFKSPPQSNMIWPILPQAFIKKLEEKFVFYTIADEGHGMSLVRLITSWATTEKDVAEFGRVLKEIGPF